MALESVCAGGGPVVFGAVPGLDQLEPGPGSPGGGHRRGAATPRGHCPAVADVFGWRRWCFAGTDRIQPSFVGVAKHYGVGIDACPPRRPNRKGVVEKAIHYLSQRWWRTDVVDTLAQAQDSLDGFCQTVGDARRRAESTVGELADAEPLLPLPAMPYPAEGTLVRQVAANGLVSVWGNRYSVPPSVIGTQVTVRWRLGDHRFDVVSASGRLVAAHRKVPRGQGRVVRLPQHTEALERVVLGAFTTARTHKPKLNRPPTPAALAIAADIGGSVAQGEPVIDLGVYQRHIDQQNRRRR